MPRLLHCHCRSVQLELDLPSGIGDVHRCNCSICAKRGAVMGSVALDKLRIVKGEDCLTLYQFNTATARHYFCSICGIYTHHQQRSDPTRYGFNVACLEGVEPFEYDDAPVYDGINHPCDRVS